MLTRYCSSPRCATLVKAETLSSILCMRATYDSTYYNEFVVYIRVPASRFDAFYSLETAYTCIHTYTRIDDGGDDDASLHCRRKLRVSVRAAHIDMHALHRPDAAAAKLLWQLYPRLRATVFLRSRARLSLSRADRLWSICGRLSDRAANFSFRGSSIFMYSRTCGYIALFVNTFFIFDYSVAYSGEICMNLLF